jgi:tetratricopeptide (TPR) repeat protein
MHQLLTHNGDERRYLIYYVQNLLRRGEVHTAEFWLDRLEQVDRQAALRDHLEQVDRQAFRTIALKAQLLKARGKSEEVVPLLNKYIGQSTGTPVMLGALLLEELGQKAAAEEMFQRFVADPKEPQGILELARFLGRQKRLPKALDQCESAWKTCPAEAVARACSAVLHAAPANQDQFLRVQRWLDAAIDKAPAVAGLKICLADLHDLRGNYQEAETVYGQVLALNNRNAEALNNLAWLLIYQDRNGLKALELINRAIEILGPVPELLDTRAGAYLALGKSEPAVAELQNALDLPGTKGTVVAVILFHLAQAQKQCGNDDACRKAMAEAKKAGLVRELVHPLEQAEFDKLSGELVGQK